MAKETYPGKHPLLIDSHYTDTEKDILESLSKEFFVTNGGEKIRLGANSEYRYAIISPTGIYQDMFNLDKEIIVVFSPYESVQARTLDAFEFVANKHSSLRIEKICNILISGDPYVEQSVENLIKNEPESQVIIPFSYDELGKVSDSFFIRNRFRKYFYTRDLFAFEAPLKKDIYFFGRGDLIQELVNRYKSGENSGVFGLRKTGKTSLINGIERNIIKDGIKSITIDCQDTSFNQRRWNEALFYVCLKTKEKLNVDILLPDEGEFSEKNASLHTEDFLRNCRDITTHTAFLIFDEIENISRKTSPAPHWRSGIDFVLFWQTLRSIFQRNNNLVSYLIVGTNPTCIEISKIDGVDNPIFNHFTPQYIPGFDVKETREMTRKLGRRMGIKFEETIYGKLNEDFGGHPFLMRHVCSLIAKDVREQERPVSVGRHSYTRGKDEFLLNHSNYIEMIVSVLKEFYSEEYEMLTLLANEDTDTFNEFAELHPSFTSHLIGYGVLIKDRSGYDFNIDAVREYILKQDKFKKIGMSLEDMWAEISLRRNKVETSLRRLIKMLMKANYGVNDARHEILKILGETRKTKLGKSSYSQLFDATQSEIYFSDLSKIISKHWDVFNNSFEKTKKEVFSQLEFINQSRADAHAKPLTKEQFAYFRLCMTSLEKDLKDSD
jgi:hypothetical protein